LSVFAGAFSLEAAEAVVADEHVDPLDVLDALGGLVAKSMLMLDDSGAIDRYRLTETMRDYGHQLLAERDALRGFEQRHADYYLRLAREAGPHLVGPDDEWWRDRLLAEYSDVRAALTFLRDQPDRTVQVSLVYALASLWWQLGMHHEAVEWILGVVDLPCDVPPRERAQVLALAGVMAASLNHHDTSTHLIDESLACTADAGEAPVAHALSARSMAALLGNRSDDAVRYGEEAIRAARAVGDPFEIANTMSATSTYVGLAGDDQRGVDLADEGLEIARRLGNRYLLSMCLASAANARYRLDPSRAIELFTESFAVSLRNTTRDSQSHFFTAISHARLREESAAARELCIALPMMQESGEPYYETMALAFAGVLLARRNPDAAVRILALIDRMREAGDFIGAARDLQSQQQLRERLEARLAREHFDALWAEGRAMTLDDMIALTLDELVLLAES
jgi:non-specific serine/threonine protein kinase